MKRNPHLAGRGLRKYSEIDRTSCVPRPNLPCNVLLVTHLLELWGSAP
jgi:hypothetical protein